jgi:sugar lactone lactonase YvrE
MNAAPAMATVLIDSQCQLGEGVIWCERRQLLYWVDIEGEALWRYDPVTAASQSWGLPDQLGCIGLARDGRMLLGLAKGLYALDLEAMEAGATVLPADLLVGVEVAHGRDTRLNDGRADRHGNFVFGTKSERSDNARIGAFYQYSAVRGLRQLALPKVAIPNSLCFSLDGRTLYFCDSLDARILACDYDSATAAVSNVRTFVAMDRPEASPDGSCIDREGYLWNAQWGASRVVRYTPAGQVDCIVEIPATQASCCAIGGARGDQLFITSATTSLSTNERVRTPAAGAVFSHRLERALALPEDRVRLI